jgi:DNA polymerase III alpha subunit
VKHDRYGQLIFSEQDLCDLVMQGVDVCELQGALTADVDLSDTATWLQRVPNFAQYRDLQMSVQEFDQQLQSQWQMPASYRDCDIAQYVLDLCANDQELQRCGHELLLYQERGLFDLLRYLRYLVDVMREHHIVWGVGRGSSVSSHVLYLMGVHRINSMYYDLDVEEFLR